MMSTRAVISRNAKVYFRDRSAVIFSLLGVLIILGLYLFFLADNLETSLAELPDATLFVGSWLVAGICAVAPVTTAMGALGILVSDREKKVSRDFLASPVKRSRLVAGYMGGGLVAAGLMTLLALVLAGGWLLAGGAVLPSIPVLLAILGVMVLALVSGVCMVFFIITFLSTNGAFVGASTVVGVLVGFLTGMYMPVGALPEGAQWAVKLFPTTHAAVLLRYLVLRGPAAASYEGVPAAVQDELWQQMGVRLTYGDAVFPLWGSVLVLAGASVVFFLLSVWNYRRKSRG